MTFIEVTSTPRALSKQGRIAAARENRRGMTDQKSSKTPPWLKRLGNRIRQVRRIRGLTQTDVARPNLTKSFISLLESGRTYPSVGTLVALANRLQTSLALLLLETSELPRETTLTLLTLARAMAESAPPEAERLLAAGEALSANSDDLRADLMLTRGDIALAQNKPRDAERIFEETLAWARRRKLRAYEPRALIRLAAVARQRQDEARARQQLEEALELFRETRTLRSVEGCDAMLTYGEMLSAQGRSARALRILEEVAQVSRRQDLPLILAKAQVGIARLRIASGQTPQAREALHAVRAALENVADTPDGAQAMREAGALLFQTGQTAEAHNMLQQALRMQERVGDTRNRSATLNELARVLNQQGKAAEAQAATRTALELAEAQHNQTNKAEILVTMAYIARQQRRWKQAVDFLREALEIFRKNRITAEVGETARELGMLLKERGEHAEAADYLAMAISTERSEKPKR